MNYPQVPTQQFPAQQLPRGVRNRNPGNVRRTADHWMGLAAEQTDPAFCVFAEYHGLPGEAWGIRCLAKILLKYQAAYRLRSVYELLHRYAPPVENDLGAYVGHVAKKLGVEPADPIRVDQVETAMPLVHAIVAHECAGWRYPDPLVRVGLFLANIK